MEIYQNTKDKTKFFENCLYLIELLLDILLKHFVRKGHYFSLNFQLVPGKLSSWPCVAQFLLPWTIKA